MNYFFFAAGIISLSACVGHFTMGYKQFLKPVLNSNIDEIPKRVMLSLFHYMSVFMAISTILLLSFGLGINCMSCNIKDAVLIIAILYSCYTIVSFTIALRVGVFKMFQWIFWLIIAVLSFLGL